MIRILGIDSLAEQLIKSLRSLGVTLWVEDGVVHGRMRNDGKLPFEARPLIDQLQAVNDEATKLIESENVVTVQGIPAAELIKTYGPRYHAGEIELVGKIAFHLQTELCDITYREAVRNER